MKKLFSKPCQFLFCLFCLFTFSASSLRAQDDAAMMQAWENWMKPGDMHAWMAKANGTWSGDVMTYWDPANPEKSKATMTSRMVFNDLYQLTEYKGNMMGMPFEGMGTLAYDNAKKEFINTWIDNMGSGVIVMTGQYDKKTNMLSLSGNQTDPMTGKDMPIRETIEFPNADTQIVTMYGPGMDGKEMKMMDIRLTRSK
jgi:hypothetical protein